MRPRRSPICPRRRRRHRVSAIRPTVLIEQAVRIVLSGRSGRLNLIARIVRINQNAQTVPSARIAQRNRTSPIGPTVRSNASVPTDRSVRHNQSVQSAPLNLIVQTVRIGLKLRRKLSDLPVLGEKAHVLSPNQNAVKAGLPAQASLKVSTARAKRRANAALSKRSIVS